MKKLYALLLTVLLSPGIAYAGLKAVASNPAVPTVSGAYVAGDCPQFNNSGTDTGAILVDAACGSGGSSPGGSIGQIQFKSTASAFGGFTLSGDCTLVYTTGVITCTKTNGNAFATVATSGSASDLGSGTLPAGRLPAPTASTLGGVQSFASSANIFLTGVNTSGAFLSARPTCGNLSDSAASCSTDATNAGNIASGTLASARGGAGTISGALKGNGAGAVSQAACADLSNATASCSTDATNATNITSGTLPAAQLPNPSASTLGGVESFASSANVFLTGLGTNGIFFSAQPATTNLSDISTFSLNTSGSLKTTFTQAASTSAVMVSSTILTGGTGTTNFPNVLISPIGATAASTWNTNGTLLGLNSPNGFTGNDIEIKNNGGTTSVFTLTRFGALTLDNSLTAKGVTINSAALSANSSSSFNNVVTFNSAVTFTSTATHNNPATFSSAINPAIVQTTLNGTTAGTVVWSQPLQGASWKAFVAHAAAYENNSAVNQTITYSTAFTNTPTVVANDTGLTVSTSTTTLTITAPNNTTLFTGNILVEGY